MEDLNVSVEREGEDRQVTLKDLRTFGINLVYEFSKLLDKILEKQDLPEVNKRLRSRDVRQLLGISASTLQSLRNSGVLRAKKVKGTFYYDKRDIKKFEV